MIGLRFLSLILYDLSIHLFAVFIHSRFTLFIRIGLAYLQTVRQGLVVAVQILEEDVIGHLLAELVVLQAAIFHKRADIVPVFLILLAGGLAQAGQLVRHLLGDVIGNLLHEAVVLQRASGNVQRQIRAVDHAL